MIALFERDVSVISRHIRNVFSEDELPEESNLQKMQIANSDRPVVFYSLDVIISVGYLVKSQRGTQFRQWATRILREHLVKGHTVNEQRLTIMPPAAIVSKLLPALRAQTSWNFYNES